MILAVATSCGLQSHDMLRMRFVKSGMAPPAIISCRPGLYESPHLESSHFAGCRRCLPYTFPRNRATESDDSVPVSIMCALCVSRSSIALQTRKRLFYRIFCRQVDRKAKTQCMGMDVDRNTVMG
jgi:hypothetical protein